MKDIYSIGEEEPWRLTKESGHRLVLAVCKTNAAIVSANIDTTCPPTHCCIRVELDSDKLQDFIEHFGSTIELAEQAGGAA